MNTARTLRAGPLQMVFTGGELRHIRLGRIELLQRIYAAVRDRNWGTVPGRVKNLVVVQNARDFKITFDSIHEQGPIDFAWRATITGTSAGTVCFTMDGTARSTFLKNRIGLCVHHPLRECAGKPCMVEDAGGKQERREFPEFVSPHQPFLKVRALTHEIRPGTSAEVRFGGDVFETEDHRNWTDANFKTYGTPLDLPFPVEVRAGTSVRQEVELRLHGSAEEPEPLRRGAVIVRVGAPSGARLPRIGLGAARDRKPLSGVELETLRRLRLAHLRVDVNLQSDPRPALQAAASDARATGAKLEVAVTLPGDVSALREWAGMTDRWLVFDANESVTGAAAAETVRAALGPDACIVVGTDAYFAELNRNRPAAGKWEAACFAVTPQVHASDYESVMANAAAQADAVRSARRFLGEKGVVVSPVTLRPRFNPDATSEAEAPPPDPRQRVPFCAAWTVASLKALTEAGAASITYYETHGPGGVLDGAETFPVFEVLEAVGEFAGARVIAAESSDSSRVAALVLASGARRRMLLANLANGPCAVQVDERPNPINLAPYGVERIDWTEQGD